MIQDKNEQGSNIMRPRTPRRGTAARHGELRQKLIAAADQLIELQGLEKLKARDLAKETGCSLGAIYSVFGDLDELILEVSANTLRAIDREMAVEKGHDPVQRLLGLAEAYISYAAGNRRRWDALFAHRMPPGAVIPDWFSALQTRAFSHIEGPLAQLCPYLEQAQRHSLARHIFAAVHGMVALGLDKRLASAELTDLTTQIALVVRAIVHGLPLVSKARS